MERPDSAPIKEMLEHWSKGLAIVASMIDDVNKKNDKATWRDEEVAGAFYELSENIKNMSDHIDDVHPLVSSLISAFSATYAGGFPAWVEVMEHLFSIITERVTAALEEQFANSPDEDDDA